MKALFRILIVCATIAFIGFMFFNTAKKMSRSKDRMPIQILFQKQSWSSRM